MIEINKIENRLTFDDLFLSLSVSLILLLDWLALQFQMKYQSFANPYEWIFILTKKSASYLGNHVEEVS